MQLSQDLTQTFGALGDPTRMAILARLAAQGDLTVQEIAEPFAMSLFRPALRSAHAPHRSLAPSRAALTRLHVGAAGPPLFGGLFDAQTFAAERVESERSR